MVGAGVTGVVEPKVAVGVGFPVGEDVEELEVGVGVGVETQDGVAPGVGHCNRVLDLGVRLGFRFRGLVF